MDSNSKLLRILCALGASTGLGTVLRFENPPHGTLQEAEVVRFLERHASGGTGTGTVAFGDPTLLEATGLSSPYENLWSLPVRVRDPHLSAFTSVQKWRLALTIASRWSRDERVRPASGWCCKSPKRLVTPTSAVCSTATSSRPTSW